MIQMNGWMIVITYVFAIICLTTGTVSLTCFPRHGEVYLLPDFFYIEHKIFLLLIVTLKTMLVNLFSLQENK